MIINNFFSTIKKDINNANCKLHGFTCRKYVYYFYSCIKTSKKLSLKNKRLIRGRGCYRIPHFLWQFVQYVLSFDFFHVNFPPMQLLAVFSPSSSLLLLLDFQFVCEFALSKE